MRRAARVDKNHREIVRALRSIWGNDCVFDCSAVGKGFPDIIVGVRGHNILMEIKAGKGKKTVDQNYFHNNWDGQVHIVRSVDDALEIIEEITT